MSNSNYKFKKTYWLFILVFSILTVFGVYLFNKNMFSLFEAFNIKPNNTNKNKNIVLIGDSILNNSAYVFENESVPALIKNKMQSNLLFYNFAKDGATIQDCVNYLNNIPEDTINSINELDSETSIFVSAGGNDILNSRDTTNINVKALFEKYTQLISAIKKIFGFKNIVVLNLYYPFTTSYKTYYPFIKQWNEILEDNQETNGYQVLKIDTILVDSNDLVYNVEPSFKGGKKLANAITN